MREHKSIAAGFVALIATFTPIGSRVHGKGVDPAESGSAYNEKGYSKDSVYTSIDGPAVNAFNFNFVVDWPLTIGLNYPENAGVSLQLSLTYNSRVWNWQNSDFHRKFMRIRRQNPYGLGFDISLGRIIATQGTPSASPYTYVDSSGAQHKLYPYGSGGTEFRSHDGSHLRGSLVSDTWTLSFPSGLVQELDSQHHISPTTTYPQIADLSDSHSPCDANDPEIGQDCPYQVFVPDPPSPGWTGFDRDYVGWHVTKVYSRAAINGSASPSYRVEYYGHGDSNAQFAYVIKTITDQFNRTIQFHLDPSLGVVDYITTPAPATEAGGSRTATYKFSYGTKTLSLSGVSIVARVLTRVSGPDVGPSGAEQRYVHTFDYEPSSGTNLGGQLNSITYPSGQLLKIAYFEFPFLNGSQGYCNGGGSSGQNPDPDVCNATTNGGTCAHSWGVNQIEKFLDGDPLNYGPSNYKKTTFTQTQVPNDYHSTGLSCSDPASPGVSGYWRYDQLNTMIDPAGNKTEFRYRTPKEQVDERFHGLLISEKYYGGGGVGTAQQLMKEIDYGTTPNCWSGDWRAERWNMPCANYAMLDTSGDYHASFEMAPTRTVTTWWDDEDESGTAFYYPSRQIEDHTDFDDFGHYQRAEFMGTAIGEPHKVLIKDYASDNVSAGGSECANATSLKANWLGDVVAREEVHEATTLSDNLVSRTEYGFDPARGLRTSEVQRASLSSAVGSCLNEPIRYTNDSIVEFGFTSDGDVETERHYVPGLSSSDGPTDVTARFTYEYGARASGKNDAFSYYNFVRVIDHDSGLPVAQRDHPASLTDTSAVTTTFAYDSLGRTTRVAHGTDAPLNIEYQNDPLPGSPTAAVALAHIRSWQGTGIDQTEFIDHFQFGRLEHSEKLNPDGSHAYLYTKYDDKTDRVSFASEWTRQTSSTGVPGTSTDYQVLAANGSLRYYEPFGRPVKVTDALGGVTTNRYFGLNRETIVKGVALKAAALDDPADVKTRYYTDALGRLRTVSKPSVISPGTGHGPYEETGAGASYTYDVVGRMTQADVSGSITTAANQIDRYTASVTSPQTRTWEYDPIGRLATTTTPESGTVTNLGWNALGQVTRSQDALGLAWGHIRQTTFDGAGRPTRLQRVLSAGSAIANSYSAGDSSWNKHNDAWRFDATGTCLPQSGVNQPAWYVGDSSCRYAVAVTTGALDLDSPNIAIQHGSILTFSYFREVRDEVGYGNHDRLSVQVQDQANTSGPWVTIQTIDSSQVSWKKWVQSPALSLHQFAGKSVKIRFEFDSVTAVGNSTLRGVGIRQVVVRRPTTVTLQETSYDEELGCTGKSLGKPTTTKDFDEGTGAPIFTRELHYCDPNARLSDEVLTFDWDRDGASQVLYDAYHYDLRGEVDKQWMPHPAGSTRRYDYPRWHDKIIGITATNESNGTVQTIIPGDMANGIQYNDAGGTSVVRYGNGLQEHIEPNAAYLPNRIWVDGGTGVAGTWSSGQYLYDGARNIKQIGDDYYRYDSAMRLTFAREASAIYGTVDLDQVYDAFGNMTDQIATRSGGGTNDLPDGLAFSGRTYANNRISSSSFGYDANGGLTSEPAHNGVLSQQYEFRPEGELARTTSDALPGATTQAAMYEGGEHRWFRTTWGDGSKALITLRDATGQVVADYLESNASSGLQLQREYVRANGQLVAINSACGPRPALALSNPHTIGTAVWFDKIDYVTPTGSYTMHVRAADGQTKTITLPASVGNHFSIGQNELFPNVQNWIQIEAQADCGTTGYSNAVSYVYDPSSPSCLRSNGGGRDHFNGSGSKLWVTGVGSCTPTTTYNIYYVDPDAEATELAPLNGSTPVADPSQTLDNIPCGSGNGNYWIRPVNPVTHHEMAGSPVITMDGTSCGGGTDASSVFTPGVPGMNLQFVHWDHLGSTRLVTDERGAQIAAFKYYPFGYEAGFSGGGDLRHKFAGHERDEGVGLDYMMARSCRMSLARFIQPDEYTGSARPALPQSWNRYAYVLNNPINAVDPTGYAEQQTPAPGGNASSKSIDDIQSPSGNDQPDNAVTAGAQGAAKYMGAAALNDAVVRARYVSQASNAGDSATRTAVKMAARESSSAVGAALAEAKSPAALESAKAGGTPNVTNAGVNKAMGVAGVVGGGLVAVSAAVSISNVASAPPGQRAQVAAHEGWKWAGALSGGEAGATFGGGVGFGLAGPPGAAIGALAGGILGGAAGGILGNSCGQPNP